MSRIGELLVREKMLSLQQLQQAQEEAKRTGKRLGATLSRLGYVKDVELTQFVAKQYSLPSINLSEIEIDASVLKLVPREICEKHQVIPVRRSGPTLIVAMADPSNIYAIDELKFLTQYNIEPVVASEAALEAALSRYYDKGPDLDQMMGEFDVDNVDFSGSSDESVNVVDLENQAGEAPVVKLCNAILLSAIKKKASDIHVEPYEKSVRVRFRIDGVMQEMMAPPFKFKAAILSRLKIMAELDIAERRVPQDGRIKIKVLNRTIDLRVSSLPTIFGEKIVMRILDKTNLNMDLEKLGFEPASMKEFLAAIANPYGMVLVTGPTGSGKTTTLYSALSRVNTPEVNVMTAEDPVEYNLDGINQVLVKEDIGLTFAVALKAFLRQDPNIIMVGEIRDLDTGSIAVKAALTGHLVLSTLHTNDAPSAIGRMIDMGVEPFLVASSVNLILAQRLVRRVCNACKAPLALSAEVLHELQLTPEQAEGATFVEGRGCVECNNTGYRGRQGVYEVMPMTPTIRDLVLERASANEIKRLAIEQGMLTLRRDALEKLKRGLTSVEEVLKETAADQF